MRPRILRLILLAAMVARLAVLAFAWKAPHRLETPDSAGYINLSASLIEDGRFESDGQAEINRTPGYPFFLAFSSALGNHAHHAAALVQVLLDVTLVYLTFLLGWMLGGDQRTGWIAAAFQAVSPLAVTGSVRILSDSLFAFLLILSLLLIVFHIRLGRRWALVAAAVTMGAACYVRPAGMAFGVICVLVLLSRRWFARAGLFAVILAACLSPWVVRNAIVAEYAGFSSFAGDSLYFFAVADLIAADEGIDPDDARSQLKRIDLRENIDRAPGPAANFRLKLALQAIGQRPWLYAKTHLKGCLGFFLPGSTAVLEVCGVTTGNRGTLDVLHKDGPLAAWRHYFGDNIPAMVFVAATGVLLLGQYLGVVLCAVRRFGRSMPAEAWLLAVVVIVAAILPGPYGLPRYRIPVEPVLAVSAALGFTRSRRGHSPAKPAPST